VIVVPFDSVQKALTNNI